MDEKKPITQKNSGKQRVGYRFYEWSRSRLVSHGSKAITISTPVVKLFLYLVACLWSSFVLAMMTHWIVYHSYVPEPLQIIPVHFNYDPSCLHGEVQLQLWSSSAPRPNIVPSTCTFPNYYINLTDRQIFAASQTYQISIHFTMPQTELNRQSGIFMVSLRFFDAKREPLVDSRKPVMLPHRSWFISLLDTIFFAPLYLLGLWTQDSSVDIDLFHTYMEDSYRRADSLQLTVLSMTAQITSAELRVHARFRGLQWVFYTFPLIAATLSVCFFTLLYLPLALLLFHRGIWRSLKTCLQELGWMEGDSGKKLIEAPPEEDPAPTDEWPIGNPFEEDEQDFLQQNLRHRVKLEPVN